MLVRKCLVVVCVLLILSLLIIVTQQRQDSYTEHHAHEWGRITGASERSPQWRSVRDAYIKNHPYCAACGTKEDLNVHHVVSFKDDPSRELDKTNLVTLCRAHHLILGHDKDGPDGPNNPNWSTSNKNVREDAKKFKDKMNPR